MFMKRTRWMLYSIVFIAIAAAMATFIARARRPRATAAPNPGLPVAVVDIIASNVDVTVDGTGDVEAWLDVEVSAQASDVVRAFYVNEGDVVTAGQTLAVLDRQQIDTLYAAADAACLSAKASLRQDADNLTNTIRQVARVSRLFNEHVVGQQEYDDADTKLKVARARLDVALAEIHRLQAILDELAVRRERYTVRAPFDGVVAERRLDPGAYVTPGTALLRLTQISPIKIKVELSELQARTTLPGQPVRIKVAALPDVVFTGTVQRVFPVLDKSWRTQTIEIDCPNENAAIRPGMFARAEIVTGHATALLVPEASVLKLPGSGISHVYTVITGVAERVDVDIVHDLGAYLAVRGSLRVGEPVVAKGQMRLQSGMRVTATPTQMLP